MLKIHTANQIEIHKSLQCAVPPMYQGVRKVSCREFQITWRVRQEESRKVYERKRR